MLKSRPGSLGIPTTPLTFTFTFTFTFTLALLLALMALAPTAEARCCFPDGDTRCADGILLKGWCCGHGSCNIFCCNCDGGCLGSPKTTKPHGGSDVDVESVAGSGSGFGATQYEVCTAATGTSIFSGDEDCGAQLFRALDGEGTGRLSVDAYLRWYRGSMIGGAEEMDGNGEDEDDEYLVGAREYFLRFDADGDGFVDESEMHRAVGG